MSHKSLSLAAALASAAISAIGAGPAAADTTVAADPTAQNVTAYGSTAAWSRKAADGYHLVVAHGGVDRRRAGAGLVARPTTPTSARRRPTAARSSTPAAATCTATTSARRAEQKLTALSSSATESAPSFFKETIVFSRTTGKNTGHVHQAPDAHADAPVQDRRAETDVAETRVIGRYGVGSKSIIRILNMNADNVPHRRRGPRPASASRARR